MAADVMKISSVRWAIPLLDTPLLEKVGKNCQDMKVIHQYEADLKGDSKVAIGSIEIEKYHFLTSQLHPRAIKLTN